MIRIERHATKHILKQEARRLYVPFRVVESRRIRGGKHPRKIILESLGSTEVAITKLEQSEKVPQTLKPDLLRDLEEFIRVYRLTEASQESTVRATRD